ncbi:MAG: hypothetical protein ABIP48_22790 [Planctomycetota bacterium]
MPGRVRRAPLAGHKPVAASQVHRADRRRNEVGRANVRDRRRKDIDRGRRSDRKLKDVDRVRRSDRKLRDVDRDRRRVREGPGVTGGQNRRRGRNPASPIAE